MIDRCIRMRRRKVVSIDFGRSLCEVGVLLVSNSHWTHIIVVFYSEYKIYVYNNISIKSCFRKMTATYVNIYSTEVQHDIIHDVILDFAARRD